MPHARSPAVRTDASAPSTVRMPCRVVRRLRDEQAFRDLSAKAAPLRCRR